MFFRASLSTHIVKVVMRQNAKKRLKGTCFRDTNEPLAGNFRLWRRVSSIFNDRTINDKFRQQLEQIMKSDDRCGTHSFCVDYGRYVGWESTAPRDDYDPEDLEYFESGNGRWEAFRVKTNLTEIEAPATSTITFVVEIKDEEGEYVAIIHSIYPGEDIGDLDGDITERENRIFFDWNHPGVAI